MKIYLSTLRGMTLLHILYCLTLIFPAVISANPRPPADPIGTNAEKNNDITWSSDWYIGTGIVKQSPSTIQSRTTEGGQTQPIDTYSDSTDSGWTIFIGKQFANYFSAELSYVDIGGGTASNDTDSVMIDYDNAYTVEIRGILNTPPVYHTELLAIFGADYVSQSGTQTDSSGTRDFHYNATTYFIGAGVQYDYKKFGLRFDWTNIQVRSNSEENISIQSLYTLSLLYKIT